MFIDEHFESESIKKIKGENKSRDHIKSPEKSSTCISAMNAFSNEILPSLAFSNYYVMQLCCGILTFTYIKSQNSILP